MSQSWRSRAWQDLAPYRGPRQQKIMQAGHPKWDKRGSAIDEEEAHELLSSPNSDGFDGDSNERLHKWQGEEIALGDTADKKQSGWAGRHASFIAIAVLLLFVVAGLGLISSSVVQDDQEVGHEASPNLDTHDSRIVRREWRNLSSINKQSYVSALKCLHNLPASLPRMPPNASSYSDFPYVHAHIGYRTHNSASFLPWHRYFLHLYEQRLRIDCGYTGGIPYWDWTLDSEDPALSPVFDAEEGFGGDGARDGQVFAGRHGRCVVDGPFAGLQVLWYDVKYLPHCLSRGFRTDQEGATGKMDGSALRPEEIEKILQLNSYEEFVTALEKQVHDVIPFGIGGDFETFSAPFEPLFWLHHSQLDRL